MFLGAEILVGVIGSLVYDVAKETIKDLVGYEKIVLQIKCMQQLIGHAKFFIINTGPSLANQKKAFWPGVKTGRQLLRHFVMTEKN